MLGLLLAGCTITPIGQTSGTDPAYVPATPAQVLQARKDAGIAACPTSSSTVAARPDGLPDLVLDCLGGDSTVRLAGLRGKPMVINLWAQWCEPCRTESPFVRQFAQAAKGKVLLLGINYNDPRPELAVEFASLVGWRQPQLSDPDRALGDHLPVPGLPVTLFVDADGKLVRQYTGALHSYDELVQLTHDALGVTL
jgi:thiol-disulfide isomerase/thioredoxin